MRRRPGDGLGSGGGDFPPRPLSVPNKRHRIDRIGLASRKSQGTLLNSVVESWVDMDADIAAINRGEGRRDGEHFWIHERRYFVKQDGGSYPVAGPGVHQVSGGAYEALKLYNAYGVSEETERRLQRIGLSAEDRAVARRLVGR